MIKLEANNYENGDGNDNKYDCDYEWRQWQPWQRKQEQLLMKNHRNNSNRNRCLKRKEKNQLSCVDKTHIEKKTTISNVFTWTRIVSVLRRYLQCIGNGDYLIALYISCWMLKIGQRRRRYRFSVYILVIIPWIADEKHFIKLTKCVMCKESVLHHSFSSLCLVCVFRSFIRCLYLPGHFLHSNNGKQSVTHSNVCDDCNRTNIKGKFGTYVEKWMTYNIRWAVLFRLECAEKPTIK